MTRLEKYLLDEAKAVTNSQTTMSRYIAIGNLIIRLSDHYSVDVKHEVDIQIIYSVNKTSVYTVFIKGNTKILHYNCKEIKEFIKSYSLIKELQTITKPTLKTQEDTIPIVESKINKDWLLSEIHYSIIHKAKSRWHKVEIDALPTLLAMEFSDSASNHKLSVRFKEFLMMNELNYKEVLSIYKYMRANKLKFGSDNITSIFERLASRINNN